MLRKPLVKCILILVSIFLLIATIQTGTAIYFSKSEPELKPADLIVVFPGDSQRIGAGIQLIKEGLSNNFMVIGLTENSLRQIVSKNDGPATAIILPGGKSRSTFEDTHQTVKTVKAHNMQSIIVVTSSYHLPRALFLLKLHLKISGSNAEVQGFATVKEHNIKQYNKEIIKFWGSLIEMCAYFATDKLILNIPSAKMLQRILKDTFTLTTESHS